MAKMRAMIPMAEPPWGYCIMLASPAAYAMIRRFESLRLRSYLDQKGKWTIGWGHTGDDIGMGMIIGLADAQRYLEDDVHWLESQLNRMILKSIEQWEFDALISWAFNVGTGPKGAKGSTLIKFLNFGEHKKAADELLRWNKVTLPNGKKIISSGLTNRRYLERQYFLTAKMD
jgi:lysozyme